LSIQQRQWYQEILQSCHCTRSLSLSPSNSSSKSHSCSHATSDLFLARRKGTTSNFLQLRSKHIIQIFSCAKKKEEDRIFFGHSSFQAHYCDLFFRLVQCFLSDHISCKAFAFLWSLLTGRWYR
jgi:hypothetical protein